MNDPSLDRDVDCYLSADRAVMGERRMRSSHLPQRGPRYIAKPLLRRPCFPIDGQRNASRPCCPIGSRALQQARGSNKIRRFKTLGEFLIDRGEQSDALGGTTRGDPVRGKIGGYT